MSQTIGGDDILTGGPRTIAAYNFGTVTITGVDGLTNGDIVKIGDGAGETMTFQVVPVPAAAWLFGSALGLLGWVRRRSA